MCHRDRSMGGAGALMATDIPGDESQQRPRVRRRDQADPVAFDALVPRRAELVAPRQVHPQLDAVEEPAADDKLFGRCLDVQDPRARCHPLGRAVGDDAASAVGVLMLERPIDHVCDGLEAPVRMPGGALWLARRVLDLAHLIHVNKRIKIGKADTGEGPAHGEAFALTARRRRRHRTDRTVNGTGERRPKTRQAGCIGGHGRHRDPPDSELNVANATIR